MRAAGFIADATDSLTTGLVVAGITLAAAIASLQRPLGKWEDSRMLAE
jgi:hypothetical protein